MYLLRIGKDRWVNPELVVGVDVDSNGFAWVQCSANVVPVRADLYDGKVDALVAELARTSLEWQVKFGIALARGSDALGRPGVG